MARSEVDGTSRTSATRRWPGTAAAPILGGDYSVFWHDAIDLMGMENLVFKMYDEPELVDTP